MLLQDSRRTARTSRSGDVVLLEDQDRSLWNKEQIAEGSRLVEQALSGRAAGSYTIQAAIAALHAEAAKPQDTDWTEIAALYDVLLRLDPSPVIELNRAVAIAMRDGPQAGLDLIEGILARGELTEYRFAHATRGELYRRIGKVMESRRAFQRALELTKQDPERRFLERRLASLGS
jgi:RNA polymerase sigma-70 factor (ECF subfamily)